MLFVVLVGLSDVPGEAMVKLYCPKCQDVYTPKSSRHHHIDGAYFGTSFPHMLFMMHPEYRPKKSPTSFSARLTTYFILYDVVYSQIVNSQRYSIPIWVFRAQLWTSQ